MRVAATTPAGVPLGDNRPRSYAALQNMELIR